VENAREAFESLREERESVANDAADADE
jgi:hypothetical protein